MVNSTLYPTFPLVSAGAAAVDTANLPLELLLNGWSPRVISDTTFAEPGSPSDGDLYLIPDSGTGTASGTSWTGFNDHWAYYFSGAWYFLAAVAGTFYSVDGTPAVAKFLVDTPVTTANKHTVDVTTGV